MSTVKANTILPDDPAQDITLGASGDTLSIGANSIGVNTFKDAGGNTLFTSDGAGTLSSVNSGFSLDQTLLSTQTADNITSLEFTTGIDSTYSTYVFKWIDAQPQTAEGGLAFNGSDSAGATYDVTKVSTFYYTWYAASGGTGAVTQWTTGQCDTGDAGTTTQRTNMGCDHAASSNPEANMGGTLWLFAPSSTDKITHWISVGTGIDSSPGVYGVYTSGFFSTILPISAMKFEIAPASYGLSGTIKMYGIT